MSNSGRNRANAFQNSVPDGRGQKLGRCLPLAAAIFALAACNSGEQAESSAEQVTGPLTNVSDQGHGNAVAEASGGRPDSGSVTAYRTRVQQIQTAIDQWQEARDIGLAKQAAETARNLVVGRAGPHYGDGDGDGKVSGATALGLLPGLAGEEGIARAGMNKCIDRDVRGGDWSDPIARWALLDQAISSWSKTNNPFPTLPSHAQRIVGWATLTLRTDSLEEAKVLGGHAKIHGNRITGALDACE